MGLPEKILMTISMVALVVSSFQLGRWYERTDPTGQEENNG